MSWETVEVSVNGKTLSAHKKSVGDALEWTIPCSSELEAGGSFECEGKSYKAESCVDVANRGEVLIVKTQETSDVKSKARRARDSSGAEEISGESDS
jgi:hypothetical protein